MPYNFDNLPSRRSTGSLKWTQYPTDVLSLWLADMDFPVAPQIQKALQEQIKHGVLGYEMPNKKLYELIVARMKKLYDWNIDPDWITYTPGVNNGYNIAARAFCSKQKGYLIQTPVYNEFHDAERFTGVKKHEAQLARKVSGNRISYEVDFDAIERGVKKSGMFLLCNPHNPVGMIFSRAELNRIAEICLANDVTIVSDEIHSEILLDDAKFKPLASISREIANHSVTLVSASKAFNVPGLVCAFAIIPNHDLRKKFRAVGNGMAVEVTTPGLTAAQVAYSGKADAWLRTLRRYLTANRDFIIAYLNENLPGVRTTKPDATYLMWLDFSEYKLQPSPFEFFLKEAKVAFSNGAVFGKGSERFVRLNFGTSRKLIMDGLKRIHNTLK